MKQDLNKYDNIVIGSGFGGIATAVNIDQKKLGNYLLLERDEEFGGTWWRNNYPGAAVDVQSHLYSFSFEPYDWSRQFAKQYEILEYTNHVIDKYGIRDHALTNAKVVGLVYDDAECEWTVKLEDGRAFIATNIINASGGLSQPKIPEFKGQDTFKGKTMHTGLWDHSYDYRNKRVAVIGSAASAIQVVPAIAPNVKELYMFQRTPSWVLPRPDRAFTNIERATFRKFPAIRQAYREMLYARFESRVLAFQNPKKLIPLFQKEAENHIKNSINSKELQKIMTPDYMMGCKRILIANDYYPTLNRDNVHVLPASQTGVDSFNETGIATTDGQQIDVDLIVYATGFHASENTVVYPITGKNGITVDEAWKDGAHAYLGTMVPDFPNLFIIAGPNTGTGHTSAIGLIESQLEYITRAIKHKQDKNLKSIEVKADVEEKYNAKIQKQLKGSVWEIGGCHSWYLTEDGKNTTLYPTFSFIFRRDCKRLKAGEHVFG